VMLYDSSHNIRASHYCKYRLACSAFYERERREKGEEIGRGGKRRSFFNSSFLHCEGGKGESSERRDFKRGGGKKEKSANTQSFLQYLPQS